MEDVNDTAMERDEFLLFHVQLALYVWIVIPPYEWSCKDG